MIMYKYVQCACECMDAGQCGVRVQMCVCVCVCVCVNVQCPCECMDAGECARDCADVCVCAHASACVRVIPHDADADAGRELQGRVEILCDHAGGQAVCRVVRSLHHLIHRRKLQDLLHRTEYLQHIQGYGRYLRVSYNALDKIHIHMHNIQYTNIHDKSEKCIYFFSTQMNLFHICIN
jgi:hypothetical protein